ncbi:sugar phosphate isomerase/epimerase family protein [Streptomyces viridochromogenes]|uniref:Putative Phosphate isomerase/epimerase n=1 Tax=Streptomyces viridochromogenes Tue57 TaxID=1160705 RepID=L8PGV2_STRVR|nr:TIM barrel protein [Streptomyces viridochromogenes]ELS56806.1 putative Phosphate isomerase/epimerase [Streptomyces viridochromogenes Tue57]
MATAPTPLRTTAGNLCLGSAPDSWGVWFPEDDHQVPYTRFLDELAAAGYEWLELGPYGYLPTDAAHLAEELTARGLKVSGGTAFGALHRPEAFDDMLAHVRQVATLTAAAGAHHLVLIPPMYRDEKTGTYTEAPELNPEQWAAFGNAADRLGRLLLDEYGIRLVLHPQMDPEILAQVTAENLSFGEAVKRGVCVSPPAGVPNPADVIAELAALDAELFVIVEQDLYPCAPEVPLPIAVSTREHLAGCGLTGTRRPTLTVPGR